MSFRWWVLNYTMRFFYSPGILCVYRSTCNARISFYNLLNYSQALYQICICTSTIDISSTLLINAKSHIAVYFTLLYKDGVK